MDAKEKVIAELAKKLGFTMGGWERKLVAHGWDAAIEAAAQVAQDYALEQWKAYKSAPISDPRRACPHTEGASDGAEEVAAKIRKLKGGAA